MKAATAYRTTNIRYSISRSYPNAADRRYRLRRILDGVLAAATAVGAFTTLVFLILL